jgi:hypothetical protein
MSPFEQTGSPTEVGSATRGNPIKSEFADWKEHREENEYDTEKPIARREKFNDHTKN